MSVITKAALLKGPRDIELIERELVLEEDEVIVRNHLVGICGSDKNFYLGQLPPKTAEFRQDPIDYIIWTIRIRLIVQSLRNVRKTRFQKWA